MVISCTWQTKKYSTKDELHDDYMYMLVNSSENVLHDDPM